jgi:acetoin:2,6-dichlorophenolindophenol oxidoreductase subunit alpha
MGGLESPIDRYRRMLLIRRFLERCRDLHDRGEIRGSIHLGIGQEAVAVGVCAALRDDDAITTTYRGHGHTIAKGTAVGEVLAEMCGRVTGCCRGFGGSLHLADMRVTNLGANAIVGAGVPTAVGAALARQLDRSDAVAVAFFGDGALNQGVVLESLNLAAVWKLPVLFACENNQFAEMTPVRTMIPTATLTERARGFGIDSRDVDGMNVETVLEATTAAVADLRAGRGPIFVEFETYRFSGHYHGDPETIRTAGQIDEWQPRDPIAVARGVLAEGATNERDLQELEAAVQAEVDEAEAFALGSDFPSAELLAQLAGDYASGDPAEGPSAT